MIELPLQSSLQGWGGPGPLVLRAPLPVPLPPGESREEGWFRRRAVAAPAGGICYGLPPFSRVLFLVQPLGTRLLSCEFQLTFVLSGAKALQYLISQLGVEQRAAGGRGVKLHGLVKGRRFLQ